MKFIRMCALSRLATISFVLALGVAAAPAQAQASRTWVSGVGDDVNPCSRTAPCKTFAGAISKTAAGGEINCLDPGGYGTVTITKSITIDCTGTFGSSLNSGGINGVNVNDSTTATPGTIEVTLRGLSINGAGTSPGLHGIRFVSGKSLLVDNVLIQGAAQPNAFGISFAPNNVNASLTVQTTTINNNGNAATGGGINMAPTGTGTASGFITNTTISQNGGIGLNAAGAVFTRVGNTTIVSNNVGLASSGGGMNASFGDNRVEGNGVDGTFNTTIAKK